MLNLSIILNISIYNLDKGENIKLNMNNKYLVKNLKVLEGTINHD